MPAKPLSQFKYMSFDVVGTLIDFESGLTGALAAIAAENGVTFEPDRALDLYRAARYLDLMRRCKQSILAPRGGEHCVIGRE